jgi:putative hydrolase of the HAD superfamily
MTPGREQVPRQVFRARHRSSRWLNRVAPLPESDDCSPCPRVTDSRLDSPSHTLSRDGVSPVLEAILSYLMTRMWWVKRGVVVFDGDDTLWFVEHLYDDARARAAAIVVKAGLDAANWESLQRRIDLWSVRDMGVSSQRFPRSCIEAYRRLAGRSSRGPDPSVEAHIRAAACSVFDSTAKPADEVGKILEQLSDYFYIALLTKGEKEIQWKRIADAGLTRMFDCISIVPEKEEHQFAAILAVLGVGVESAWSVGNSLASDINPALRIGMRAIWIDAPVWEYERRESKAADGCVLAAPDLASAAEILRQYSAVSSHP